MNLVLFYVGTERAIRYLEKEFVMKTFIRILITFISLASIVDCTKPSTGIDSRWALLPIVSNVEAPQQNQNEETISTGTSENKEVASTRYLTSSYTPSEIEMGIYGSSVLIEGVQIFKSNGTELGEGEKMKPNAKYRIEAKALSYYAHKSYLRIIYSNGSSQIIKAEGGDITPEDAYLSFSTNERIQLMRKSIHFTFTTKDVGGEAILGFYNVPDITPSIAMYSIQKSNSSGYTPYKGSGKHIRISIDSSNQTNFASDVLPLEKSEDQEKDKAIAQLVSGVSLKKIDFPQNFKSKRKYEISFSVESYLDLSKVDLEMYTPDGILLSSQSATLISRAKGDYKIFDTNSTAYTYRVSFTTPGFSDIQLRLRSYFRGIGNDMNFNSIYTLIANSISKNTDRIGRSFFQTTNRAYYGQENTGVNSDNNCGAATSVMACNWAKDSGCPDVSTFRAYVDGGKAGYLTVDQLKNGLSHYGVSPGKVSLSEITKEDIINELNNGNMVIVLFYAAQISHIAEQKSYPILNRFYNSINGDFNHFLLIKDVLKDPKTGIEYFIVNDPYDLGVPGYSDSRLSFNGTNSIPKGRDVRILQRSLIDAMNHSKVKNGDGSFSYLVISK